MEKPMTEYRWVKLLQFKAGMRYFRDTLTDKVAAADNSGRYPENTDDGVLWLDLDNAVTVELGSREYSRVTVPVKSVRGNGKGYYVGEEIAHLPQFLPLWTSLGGKVELRGDINADVLQQLLEVVTRPLQKKCAKCDHFLPPGMVSGCHLIKVNGTEVPCFGPDEVAKAKDARQDGQKPGAYAERYFAMELPAGPRPDGGRALARAVMELTLPPSVRTLAEAVLAQGDARMSVLPRLTSLYIDARDTVTATREKFLQALQACEADTSEIAEAGRDLAVAVGAERTSAMVLAEASVLMFEGK